MKPFSKYFFIIFFCDTLFILPTILTVECFCTFACYFFYFSVFWWHNTYFLCYWHNVQVYVHCYNAI